MRGAGVLRKGCGAGETLRCAGGPRPGLCRYRLRWLESAVNHAGRRVHAMWRSSSLRCRKVTTWRAGVSALWSATKRWSVPWRESKAITITALFTPLQVAAIAALEGDQQCVRDIAEQYKRRRDVLVKGLHEAGWMVEMPKASMYVWAKIPEPYAAMGSLEFAKKLLNEAKVCVSPGIGFGDYGDTHVRFALIENRDRIRQAIRGIKAMFRADGLLPASSKHIHENAE